LQALLFANALQEFYPLYPAWDTLYGDFLLDELKKEAESDAKRPCQDHFNYA
jgi:hypothetical protein